MRIASTLLALALLPATAFAQNTSARTEHVRAELVRDGSELRLRIEPRRGWRIIAADDTLTGRPLRVFWEGAVAQTQLPGGARYAFAQDTTRVYNGRIEMKARALKESISARVDYIACREVCVPGNLVLRASLR